MKTLVFGAGFQGFRYLDYTLNRSNGERGTVVGFLDNNAKMLGEKIKGRYPCYLPEKVEGLQYDKIVIANESDDARIEMQSQLLALGVLPENIVFFPDAKHFEAVKASYERRCDFFQTYARFAGEERIMGNVAECGVNRGRTAECINSLYPDRKLYLFDTFEGFAQQDVDVERTLNNDAFLYSSFNRAGVMKSSVDFVMGRMKYPENIIIKKGWVPETFGGVEDIFCFVHLDMDLYQPMLEAMKFFWDKMSKKGVILLHDYHNPRFGVKRAVIDFEAYLGREIAKLPVNSSVGLALIKAT